LSNNATVGGILNIIAGIFGVIGGGSSIILSGFVSNDIFDFSGATVAPIDIVEFSTFLYSAIGIFLLLVGVLGIVGGVYALKREKWGLALAGAIAGAISFLPVGIPAIIFVTLARPDFLPKEQPEAGN
jgi:hypothetical protein